MRVAIVFTLMNGGYYIEEILIGDKIHGEDGISQWDVEKIIDDEKTVHIDDVVWYELKNPSIKEGKQFVVIQESN